MAIIHRRSFLERLGLGIGATLLSPIAQSLVNEARGQVTTRKVWGIYMFGHGLRPESIGLPAEMTARGAAPQITPLALPSSLSGLSKYRDRMVLLDGLDGGGLHSGSDHSLFHAALACVPGRRTDRAGGFAGGQTIDKYIADRLGKSTRFDALRCGLAEYPGSGFAAGSFAEGMGRQIQHHVTPKGFFDYAFSDFKATSAPDPAANAKTSARRRMILDLAKGDITRLRAQLAGPEAQKLDKYLAVLEEFDGRQSAVSTLSCKAPGAPGGVAAGGNERFINDELEAMIGMQTIAVACGLTNVFALAIGSGAPSHGFPHFNIDGKDVFPGGHGDWSADQRTALTYVTGLLGKMFDAFSSLRIGDKTLFDNMAFTMMSDNANAHHTVSRERWPLLLVGNAGGGLKVDGRLIRYGRGGAHISRVHLMTANAVGATVAKWGPATAGLGELQV